MEEGKLDEALADFDRAVAICESQHRHLLPGLQFQRGDALARMGRSAEAEAAFQKEIELYPRNPRPYKNLILLYVTEGKNDAATQLIFAMEKAAPTPPTYLAISDTLRVVGDANGARFWAARGLSHFPNNRALQAKSRG
jgi:Flp pilus assembly protein TadD